MLKASAPGLFVFGLSERNLEKLRDGQPILVDLAEMGASGKVIIFYGKTEADMERELADLIGAETQYRNTTGRAN